MNILHSLREFCSISRKDHGFLSVSAHRTNFPSFLRNSGPFQKLWPSLSILPPSPPPPGLDDSHNAAVMRGVSLVPGALKHLRGRVTRAWKHSWRGVITEWVLCDNDNMQMNHACMHTSIKIFYDFISPRR